MVACESDIKVPVVVAVSVKSTRVAAVAAVEPKSSKVPLVAPPVSIELELMRTSEPVSAMTLVVCAILIPTPVVNAPSVPNESAVPVVRPDATSETKMPVVAMIPDEVNTAAFPVVRPFAITVKAVPVVAPLCVILKKLFAPVPVCTPDPVNRKVFAVVDVLLVIENVPPLSLSAIVRDDAPEQTMSPFWMVSTVEPSEPRMFTAPVFATENTVALPVVSHASK